MAAAQLWRTATQSTCLLHPRALVAIGNRRNILSTAFASNDAWRACRNRPEFTQLTATDLGNRLLQTLDRGQDVAPIDFDIYVHKLDETDPEYVEFFQPLLKKFNATQSALQKLASTDHALVRAMLQLRCTDQLLNWLQDKFTFGVFLDEFSTALVVDEQLRAGNTKEAAYASFDFATQQQLRPNDVCVGLSLLASSQRLAQAFDSFVSDESKQELAELVKADDQQDDEEDDDDDVVYVDWIRQPNYDDNFDINEEKLQLGKTLWLNARQLLISGRQSQSAIDSAAIGLAAYEKAEKLMQLLTDRPGAVLSQSAATAARQLLSVAPTRPDGVVQQPGRRPVSSEKAVQSALELIGSVTTSGESKDWPTGIESWTRELISSAEATQAARLSRRYAEFDDERQRQLRQHNDWLRKRELFQSVKRDLSQLIEEQEVLTSVENAKDIMYSAWLAPRTAAERNLSSKKVWQEDVQNLQKYIDEFYETQPKDDRPTSKRTRSKRIKLKEGSKNERFQPLSE